MPAIAPDFTDDDIAALESWCERLSEHTPQVAPDWVDGYLTALVCGPRAVSPSEYLTLMFGESLMHVLNKADDFETFMGLLMRRWNALADELRPERLIDEPDEIHLNPLMSEYPQDEIAEKVAEGLITDEQAMGLQTGGGWARGFGQAMLDFEDDWEVFEEGTAEFEVVDFNVRAVMSLTQTQREALRTFCEQAYGEAELSRDDLIAQAMLAVQDLRLFWLQHQPKNMPVRNDDKTGRNDPCPCGSGLKFKKCCGAAPDTVH
ncbi:MAG: YecA family protein [Rubrivivax sp.]|nr:MAG: YecA family protein [Rubrivivax sp.]